MTKISAYTPHLTPLNSSRVLLDITFDTDGLGAFDTFSIAGDVFTNLIKAEIPTLYSADGTLGGAREIITDGNNLSVTGTGNFAIGNNAPGTYKLRVVSGSAQDALRIDTDSQSNQLVIDDDGAKGLIGFNTVPTVKFHYFTDNPLNDPIVFEGAGDHAESSSFFFYKHRGTQASPTAILNADKIGLLGTIAHNGTSTINPASILFTATENHAVGSGGTKIAFFTTENGTNSPFERVTIDHNGNVGINTLFPTEKLVVIGSILMSDGNEALDKIMKSDASGVASWQLLKGGTLQKSIYVSKDGDDSTGKLADPDFPFLTIQAAIDAGIDGTTIVYVFAGTYTEDIDYDPVAEGLVGHVHLINATIIGNVSMKNNTYLTSENKTGKVDGFIDLSTSGSAVAYIRDMDEITMTGTSSETGISANSDNRLLNIDNVNKIITDNVGAAITGRFSWMRNVGLFLKKNNVTDPQNRSIFSSGKPNKIENCNFLNTEVDGHMFISTTNYETTFKNCQFECDGSLHLSGFGTTAQQIYIDCSFKSVSQELWRAVFMTAKFFNCTFEVNAAETFVFVDGGNGNKTLEFYNCISNKTLYDTGNPEFIVIENGGFVDANFTVDHDFSTEQEL